MVFQGSAAEWSSGAIEEHLYHDFSLKHFLSWDFYSNWFKDKAVPTKCRCWNEVQHLLQGHVIVRSCTDDITLPQSNYTVWKTMFDVLLMMCVVLYKILQSAQGSCILNFHFDMTFYKISYQAGFHWGCMVQVVLIQHDLGASSLSKAKKSSPNKWGQLINPFFTVIVLCTCSSLCWPILY